MATQYWTGFAERSTEGIWVAVAKIYHPTRKGGFGVAFIMGEGGLEYRTGDGWQETAESEITSEDSRDIFTSRRDARKNAIKQVLTV
jgi:hypothetical protein